MAGPTLQSIIEQKKLEEFEALIRSTYADTKYAEIIAALEAVKKADTDHVNEVKARTDLIAAITKLDKVGDVAGHLLVEAKAKALAEAPATVVKADDVIKAQESTVWADFAKRLQEKKTGAELVNQATINQFEADKKYYEKIAEIYKDNAPIAAAAKAALEHLGTPTSGIAKQIIDLSKLDPTKDTDAAHPWKDAKEALEKALQDAKRERDKLEQMLRDLPDPEGKLAKALQDALNPQTTPQAANLAANIGEARKLATAATKVQAGFTTPELKGFKVNYSFADGDPNKLITDFTSTDAQYEGYSARVNAEGKTEYFLNGQPVPAGDTKIDAFKALMEPKVPNLATASKELTEAIKGFSIKAENFKFGSATLEQKDKDAISAQLKAFKEKVDAAIKAGIDPATIHLDATIFGAASKYGNQDPAKNGELAKGRGDVTAEFVKAEAKRLGIPESMINVTRGKDVIGTNSQAAGTGLGTEFADAATLGNDKKVVQAPVAPRAQPNQPQVPAPPNLLFNQATNEITIPVKTKEAIDKLLQDLKGRGQTAASMKATITVTTDDGTVNETAAAKIKKALTDAGLQNVEVKGQKKDPQHQAGTATLAVAPKGP